MSDKVFILVICCLIFLGIYSYQKAIHERGGITPLQEILHGKSKDEDEGKFWSDKVDSINLQQSLKNFRQHTEENLLKKNALLERRRADLNALLASNLRIYQLAREHLSARMEEYKQLEEPVEALTELRKEIVSLTEWPDPSQRQAAYEAKKTQILRLVNTIQAPPEDIEVIQRILLETQEMLGVPFDGTPWGCRDSKTCVSRHMNALGQQLEQYLNARIMTSIRQLEDLVELCRILEHEYKFLILNTNGTDEKIGENNKILEEELDAALLRLSDLNYEDMGKFLKLFQAAEKEQVAALSNLDEHHSYFQERFKDSTDIQQAIVDRLDASGDSNLRDIASAFREEKSRNDSTYEQLRTDSIELMDLLAYHLKADEDIVRIIADHVNVDLEALREEMGLEQSAGGTVSVGKPAATAPVVVTDETLPVPSLTTQDDMERLREKARRDEETLQRMFEVYGSPLE